MKPISSSTIGDDNTPTAGRSPPGPQLQRRSLLLHRLLPHPSVFSPHPLTAATPDFRSLRRDEHRPSTFLLYTCRSPRRNFPLADRRTPLRQLSTVTSNQIISPAAPPSCPLHDHGPPCFFLNAPSSGGQPHNRDLYPSSLSPHSSEPYAVDPDPVPSPVRMLYNGES